MRKYICAILNQYDISSLGSNHIIVNANSIEDAKTNATKYYNEQGYYLGKVEIVNEEFLYVEVLGEIEAEI
jgi:hypothetical protein